MPNYVTNTISLTGKQSDIDSICELLKNKKPDANEEIDFNNVVPMPNSMNVAASSDARWYIASYVKTLSDEEKLGLIEELCKYSDGFYKSYAHKYKEAFTEDIPDDTLNRMQKTFQEEYSAINPNSIEEVGETDLATVNSRLSTEWDYGRNKGVTLEMVTAHSSKKYYWRCKKGHSWMASVASRSKGTGCPYCK